MEVPDQLNAAKKFISYLSIDKKTYNENYFKLISILRHNNPLYIAGNFAVAAAQYREHDDSTSHPRVVAYLLSLLERNFCEQNLELGYIQSEESDEIYSSLRLLVNCAAVSGIKNNIHFDAAISGASEIQGVQDIFVTGKGYYKYRKSILCRISERFSVSEELGIVTVEQVYSFIEKATALINHKLEQRHERALRLRKKMRSFRSNDEFQNAWRIFIGEKNPAIFDVTCLYRDYARVMDSFSTLFNEDRILSDEIIFPGAGTTYSFAPIWKVKGRYYVFDLMEFEDNLYSIYIDYLARQSSKLKEKFEKARAKFVEKTAAELFASALHADFFLPNAKYRDGDIEGETDAVIGVDDILYVLEVKSHKFRPKSLKGNEQSFEKQLRESVEAADRQAAKFISFLQSSDSVYVNSGKMALELRKSHFREIRKVIVSFEDLSPHFATLDNILKARIIDFTSIPWIVSLHDLMAIVEVLDRPELFVQYVEMRLRRNMRKDLYFHNEMEVLGFFLKKGADFPKEKERGKHFITGQAEELDVYFNQGGKKPECELPTSISSFLKSMAECKLNGWAAFARCLVGVCKEGLNALNDFLKGVVPVNSGNNESHSYLFKSENFNVLILFDEMNDELVSNVKQDVTGVLFAVVCHSSLPLRVLELRQLD